MATVEIATFDNFQETHVNLSHPVGVGQKNERNDVMAVQALFQLVGNSELRAGMYFGSLKRDLPEVTGRFDEKTIRALTGFQRKMASRLLSADGKIHPASYRNRIMRGAYGVRLMAITLLNMEAVIQADWIAHGPVPDAVKILAPSIRLN